MLDLHFALGNDSEKVVFVVIAMMGIHDCGFVMMIVILIVISIGILWWWKG